MCCAVLMLCSSCANRENHDKTVDVERTFTLEGKAISDIVRSHGDLDFIRSYPDAEALYPQSSLIAVGEVADVCYSDSGGIATTYFDFKISECWDGQYSENDIITVAHNGGYIRGSVFNAQSGYDVVGDDDLILENIYDIPLPETGERYILFLTDWIDGMYIELDCFMARYFIDENGGISRFIPDDWYCQYMVADSDDPDTLDEMRDFVASIASVHSLEPLTMDENRELFKEWLKYEMEINDAAEAEWEEREPKTSEEIASDVQIVVDAYQKLIDKIRESVKKTDSRPSVLILGDESPYLVAGGDTYKSSMIIEAGGVNAAEDYNNKGNFVRLTMKEIKALKPDYILIPEGAVYDIEDVTESEEWSKVKAIKNGNIIIMPIECANQMYSLDTDVGRGSYYLCQGIAFLHYSIHGEIYSKSEFIEDLTEYFEAVEQVALTEKEPVLEVYGKLGE